METRSFVGYCTLRKKCSICYNYIHVEDLEFTKIEVDFYDEGDVKDKTTKTHPHCLIDNYYQNPLANHSVSIETLEGLTDITEEDHAMLIENLTELEQFRQRERDAYESDQTDSESEATNSFVQQIDDDDFHRPDYITISASLQNQRRSFHFALKSTALFSDLFIKFEECWTAHYQVQFPQRHLVTITISVHPYTQMDWSDVVFNNGSNGVYTFILNVEEGAMPIELLHVDTSDDSFSSENPSSSESESESEDGIDEEQQQDPQPVVEQQDPHPRCGPYWWFAGNVEHRNVQQFANESILIEDTIRAIYSTVHKISVSEVCSARNESIYSDIDLNDEPACLHLEKESEEDVVESAESEKTLSKDSEIFKVRIVDIQKVGGFFDVHFEYRLETEFLNVTGYPEKHYETWRRFTDFVVLHEKIVEKYRTLGLIIPQPPEKKVSVMAKAMTNTHTTHDPELLQRARHLERYLNRVIQHPRIRSDCDVRDFLAMDMAVPPHAKQDVFSAVGVMKAFNGFKEAIDKFTIPMEETDQWFEKCQSFYDELDFGVRKLYEQTTALVSSRKEMAITGEQLAKSLSSLAASEDSTTLSLALSALTDTYDQCSVIWSKQTEQHVAKFQESIEEYILLIDSLHEVFDKRVHIWQQFKKTQKTLEELKAKMETCDNEKVDELNREIDEMERTREQFGSQFDEISLAIREEVTRFEAAREKDMKTMLVNFVEDMIRAHTVMGKLWEQFEPFAHKILGGK